MVGQYLTASKRVGSIQWNLYWPYLKRASVLVPPIEDLARPPLPSHYMDLAHPPAHRGAKQKLIGSPPRRETGLSSIAPSRVGSTSARASPTPPTNRRASSGSATCQREWEVRRAKTLFREVDQRSATGSEVLLSLRMYEGLIPHHQVSHIPTSAEALVGYKRVEPGQYCHESNEGCYWTLRGGRQASYRES